MKVRSIALLRRTIEADAPLDKAPLLRRHERLAAGEGRTAGQRQCDVAQVVPDVATADAFGQCIQARKAHEQRLYRRGGDATGRALHRRLALAPHPRALDCYGDRRPGGRRRKNRGQRMQIFTELPKQQGNTFALVLEGGQDAARPRGVARQPRFRELKNIEARHVGNGILDCRLCELSPRQKQTDFFDLLLRGKKIALGGVGEKLQGLGRRALLLEGEAGGDPARQVGALQRIDFHRDAGLLERGRRVLIGADSGGSETLSRRTSMFMQSGP